MRTATSLLLAAAVTVHLAVTRAPRVMPPLQWGASTAVTPAGDSIPIDTATLSVPQRHASPSGPAITLPLLRLRSTGPNPGAPILYLAGGPGSSGLSALRDPDRTSLLLALRAIGDVVLFDQRGTGGSRPSLVIPARLDLPSDTPVGDPAVLDGLVARVRQFVAALRAQGVDLDAYNTVESAHDVDLLRQSLGVDRVTLWGHSYGSHLALAVLKLHPTIAERVIIGGINGLHQRWRLPNDGDVWLARIDSAVKADPRLRALEPDLLGNVRATFERLEREPLRVQVQGRTILVGRNELATVLALTGGDVAVARRLPLTLSQIRSGDVQPIALLVQQALRERQFGTAMTYAMHIASGVDATRAARIGRESPHAILRNAINYPFDVPAFRDAWGMTDLGDAFRAPVTSAVPVLVLSGTFDGRTSITDAEEVRAGLSDSRHIIVDGAGHNFYTSSPLILNRMLRFLRGERVAGEHIAIPSDFRGPDEPKLVLEIRNLVVQHGAAAAVKRLGELRNARDAFLTSYVPGTVAVQLLSDKRPADAVTLLNGATPLFPTSVFLYDRLGEALLATNDPTAARAAWQRALEVDPNDVFAASQIRRLPH